MKNLKLDISIKVPLIFLIICYVRCEYITSSTVQKCYSSKNEPLNCKEKVVIVLSLENGQIANTERIEATLSEATQNGVSRQIKNNIVIEVTKSPVTAIFPLKYKQDFNNQPKERIITTNLFSCNDGFYGKHIDDSSPSCGFQKDAQGQKILDSQGYCCYCSWKDIFGMGDDLARGKVCYALNLGSGSATAHCLTFDPLWYSAYEVSQYQLYFEVIVKIYEIDDSKTKQLKWTIKLSTSNPTVKSVDNSAIIKIIGTFTPTKPPADLSSVYLLKPSSPSTHSRVIEGTNAWMFIDKSMFTLDGTECNKIGVSYTAFKDESSSCSKPIGSCLKNQPDNFYQKDLAQKKQPNYLLESKGVFNSVKFQEQTALQQVLDGSASTLITIEIDAAIIKFVTNLGIGKFLSASINNFESHSGNGKLLLEIQNLGDYSAEFVIAFECSSNVEAIQGKKLFLTGNEIQKYTCSVNVLNDKGVNNNNCTTTLLDAIGTQLDQKVLLFNTTAVNTTNNQGNNTNTDKQEDQVYEESKSCEDKCPNYWNFLCAFAEGCWGQGFKSIGTILGIAGGIGLFAWLAKNGYLAPLCRFLCFCCSGSKQKEQSNKQENQVRKKYNQDHSVSDKSFCSHSHSQSQSQSYQTPTKEKEKKNINRKQSASSKYILPVSKRPSSQIRNEESHLEESFEINEYIANINKDSTLFKDFGFKKSFSFIVLEKEGKLYYPQESNVPQLVGKKGIKNTEYVASKLLSIVKKNAAQVITDSPRYLLIE